MSSPPDLETKKYTMSRISERLAEESEILPYRWGYFQGVILIPKSFLNGLGALTELVRLRHGPWYLDAVGLLIGLVGFPLAIGLLLKRVFALVLVYLVFGLSLLMVAIKLPIAIRHFTDSGDIGSAFPEALLLMFWLFSLQYYRRRKRQFR